MSRLMTNGDRMFHCKRNPVFCSPGFLLIKRRVAYNGVHPDLNSGAALQGRFRFLYSPQMKIGI